MGFSAREPYREALDDEEKKPEEERGRETMASRRGRSRRNGGIVNRRRRVGPLFYLNIIGRSTENKGQDQPVHGGLAAGAAGLVGRSHGTTSETTAEIALCASCEISEKER